MVKYGYANTVDKMIERLQYDLIYLENRSLSIDIKILGFIDSYKKTTSTDNLKIYNIKDFKHFDKTIIICTYYEEWIDEIVNLLSKNGFNNYFINIILNQPGYYQLRYVWAVDVIK